MIDIPRRRATTLQSSNTNSQAIFCTPGNLASHTPETRSQSSASLSSLQKPVRMIDRAPFPAIGLGIDTTDQLPLRPIAPKARALKSSNKERQFQAFNRIRSRTTWSPTPPRPSIDLPQSSKTVKQKGVSIPISRPPTPIPVVDTFKLSEINRWILVEIESAIFDAGSGQLELGSPVMQQICLPSRQRHIPNGKPPIVPQSKFSVTKDLSSNRRSPFQFIRSSRACADHASTGLCIQAPNNDGHNNPRDVCPEQAPAGLLTHLCRIFPSSPHASLSSLLAVLLALNFINSTQCNSSPRPAFVTSLKHSSQPAPSYKPHFPKPPPYSHDPGLTQNQQQPPSLSNAREASCSSSTHSTSTSTSTSKSTPLPDNIPSKARAMLGLPPSTTSPSISRPPLPAFWRKVEQREWMERIAEVKDALWAQARRMIGEAVGYQNTDAAGLDTTMIETLLRAVVEFVGVGTGLGLDGARRQERFGIPQ